MNATTPLPWPQGHSSALPAGLVPLVVGVTGHRDIWPGAQAAVAAAVRAQLQAFAQAHPHSPRVLLSALAEGADQLAAREALALGWALGVVLPFGQAEYEQDFASAEQLADFRQLLAQAAFVQVMPAQAEEAARWGLSVRDCGYRAAGVRILQLSQVLLALWDGASARKPGGTTDVVQLFLEGIPASASSHDKVALPDTGAVWQVVTPRSSQPDQFTGGAPGDLVCHWPRPAGLDAAGEPQRWQRIWRRVDQFNADARAALAERAESVARSRSYLGPQAQPAPGSEGGAETTAAARAAALHAVADVISVQSQRERQRWYVWMIGLAVAAFAFINLYSGPLFHPLFALLVVLAGVLGYGLLHWVRRQQLEQRYLDYRALAEACRVQHYWKLADLRARVSQVFLRGQRDELEWLRQAVNSTELVDTAAPLSASERMAALRLVDKQWIQDQQKYFVGIEGQRGGNKALFNEREASRWNALGLGFFGAGALLVVLVCLTHWALHPVAGDSGLYTGFLYAVVAYNLLLALAGVAYAYRENKAFVENARRYRRTGLMMSMAHRELDGALAQGRAQEAEAVLEAVGTEALAENSDWLITHRDRPVSLPVS